MLCPADEEMAEGLMGRLPRGKNLTPELVEDLKRLFFAMLNLEEGHDHVRMRVLGYLNRSSWTFLQVF